MPRQITVLDTRKAGDGRTQINGAFWFSISNVNARVPRPQYVSVLLNVPSPQNVTAAEQAQVESGEVRDESFAIEIAASTTLPQAKADLQRRYTDRAAAVSAEPATRQFYGLTFDGSAWSA